MFECAFKKRFTFSSSDHFTSTLPISRCVYLNSAFLIAIVNTFRKSTSLHSILSDGIEKFSLKVINSDFELGVIFNFKANPFTITTTDGFFLQNLIQVEIKQILAHKQVEKFSSISWSGLLCTPSKHNILSSLLYNLMKCLPGFMLKKIELNTVIWFYPGKHVN